MVLLLRDEWVTSSELSVADSSISSPNQLRVSSIFRVTTSFTCTVCTCFCFSSSFISSCGDQFSFWIQMNNVPYVLYAYVYTVLSGWNYSGAYSKPDSTWCRAHVLGECLVVEHDWSHGDLKRREAREHRAHVRVLRLLEAALVHQQTVPHIRSETRQLLHLANGTLVGNAKLLCKSVEECVNQLTSKLLSTTVLHSGVRNTYSIDCEMWEQVLAEMWELQELRRIFRGKQALHDEGLDPQRALERPLDSRNKVLRYWKQIHVRSCEKYNTVWKFRKRKILYSF